jgi:hypothetical protein
VKRVMSCATAFVSVLLAGCVATGSQQIATYATQLGEARVVSNFREVPATTLPMNEVILQSVGRLPDEKSPTFAIELDGERTFVSLFKLPSWTAPYSISVASMMFGGSADPAIFYPRYLFLREDFTVSRRSSASDFVFRTGASEGMVTATAYLNEDNRDERYLAIVAEPRNLVTEKTALAQSEGAVPLVVPVGSGAMAWMVRTGGNEGPRKMRAAASGLVRIKTELYKPKRFGE